MFDFFKKHLTLFKKENTPQEHGFLPVLLGFLARFLAVIVFIGYPLLTSNLVVRGGGFEKFIFFYLAVLLITSLWLLQGVLSGSIAIKRTPLDWPLFLFLAVLVVSAAMGVSPKDSWLGSYGGTAKGLVGLLSLTVFYYFVANAFSSRYIKIIFFFFASSLLLMASFSLAQFFGHFVLPWEFTKNQFFNTAGSLSNFGSLIIISLPFLVILAAQANRIFAGKIKSLSYIFNIIFSLGLLVVLLDLLALRNFIFWPVILVGASVILVFYMSRLLPYNKAEIFWPLTIFLIAVVFVVTGVDNISKSELAGKVKLLSLNLPFELNLNRDISWQITKGVLHQDPILGEGPATFYHSFSLYKPESLNKTTFWDVRFERSGSYLLEILANWGILGSLAALVLFLTSLTLVFLSLIKTQDESFKPVLLGFLSSLITAAALAAVFPFDGTVFLFVGLLAVLAAATAISAYPEEFSIFNLSFRAAPKYALTLSVLFLALGSALVYLMVVGVKAYTADIYARKSLESPEVDKKIAALQQAVNLFPYQDAYYLDLSKGLSVVSVNEATRNKDKKKAAEAIELAASYSKRALAMNPNRLANVESDALMWDSASFYVEGAFANAEKSFKRAAELDPNNPMPYVRLAIMESNHAQFPGLSDEKKREYLGNSIKYYDEAIKRKDDIAEVRKNKAMIYDGLNDFDNALKEMSLAVEYSGNNPDYIYELGKIYFNKGATKAAAAKASSTAPSQNNGDKESPSENTTPVNNLFEINEDLMAAEAIFKDVYSLDKNNLSALYSLAVLYKKTGNYSSSNKYLEEFFAANPNKEQNEEIRKQFSDF